MSAARQKMKTIGGMSVRSEIDARIEAARMDGRTAGIEEAIDFFRRAGHTGAADLLETAAFGPPQREEPK